MNCSKLTYFVLLMISCTVLLQIPKTLFFSDNVQLEFHLPATSTHINNPSDSLVTVTGLKAITNAKGKSNTKGIFHQVDQIIYGLKTLQATDGKNI